MNGAADDAPAAGPGFAGGPATTAPNRFDAHALSMIAALGAPVGQPLPRFDSSEPLVSNLRAVEQFVPMIYEASTPCRERADGWERMRSHGAFESGFVLSKGRRCRIETMSDPAGNMIA